MPPSMGPAQGLRYETLRGDALRPLLPALGELVFAVFRGWPYLYGGDQAGARRYLASYADGSSPGAAAVVAFDGDELVGAATCQPMAEASPGVPAAFAARGLDPARFCYFGEAVLLAPYRGRGAGARFFEEREGYARGLGLDFAAFCAVRRDPADPRKPAGYKPLDAFWRLSMRSGASVATLPTRIWSAAWSGGRSAPRRPRRTSSPSGSGRSRGRSCPEVLVGPSADRTWSRRC